MKYIDADKLIAEIERRIDSWSIRGKNSPVGQGKDTCESRVTELSDLLSFINSLQQERPNAPKSKFNFPKFLYARTLDNKTIDISYAPQNMDAIEYVRNDLVEQEQPMPDSTKLIEFWHETKEMLKEKDFRDDPWRLAYNAFMCGFGRGIAINKQEQPDNEDIDKVAQELCEHLYELKRRNNVLTNLYDKQEIIDLWKAGIEYGRNHPNKEQPEVDLEKYISDKLFVLGADLINHKPYSFNRGLNVGMSKAYADILTILNARKEEIKP